MVDTGNRCPRPIRVFDDRTGSKKCVDSAVRTGVICTGKAETAVKIIIAAAAVKVIVVAASAECIDSGSAEKAWRPSVGQRIEKRLIARPRSYNRVIPRCRVYIGDDIIQRSGRWIDRKDVNRGD